MQEAIDLYPNDVINVVFRASNGSSFKPEQHFAIIPPKSNEIAINGIESNKTATTSNLDPKIATNMQQNSNFLSDFIIQDLKEKNTELKLDNKQLQGENKQLLQEKNTLERRIELQEKDFLIEKLETQATSKAGLNGFIESASENPAMMSVFATVLGKVVGVEQMPIPTEEEQPKLPAATFQIKEERKFEHLINYTSSLIQELSDEQAQIFGHLMKLISTDKNILETLIQK